MKKALKITALLMALLLTVACFAGCGKTADTKPETTSGAEDASATDVSFAPAKDANTIVFGTNAEFPPFEYVSTDGIIDSIDGTMKFDGIDMAIANKIGTETGKTAVINNMEFDSLIVALNNGQVDAVIAGMTATEERAKSVDFSTHYYVASQVMIVKADSDIASAKDMEGKSIAVIQGYTGETVVQELGYKYESFKKGTEAVLELKNGKCDVIVIDSATADKYVADNADLKIVKDTEAFESEEYAIAVKKGNTELLAQINAVIDKMIAAGEIGTLSDAYIGA